MYAIRSYYAGVKQNETPYTLAVGESIRLEYDDVNVGPVAPASQA